MLNITALLESIRESPYRDNVVVAPHTGRLTFASDISLGQSVTGPTGLWKEKAGTLLAILERERNPKPITALEKGEICALHSELEGQFVQAGTAIATIRHMLTREEVEHIILQQTLHLFAAPERAKYYFIPEVDKKMHASDEPSVKVHPGMELFIMSRMKREVHLNYTGPAGIIYAVYFKHNENIDAGAPLVGICTSEQLPEIQEVIARIKTEWK
ncbi:MAG: biotin attachment protein [Desulfovibrionaceae bacterium]|nr:biotin attachment protein [Desulfovibrionaceae bacterium]